MTFWTHIRTMVFGTLHRLQGGVCCAALLSVVVWALGAGVPAVWADCFETAPCCPSATETPHTHSSKATTTLAAVHLSTESISCQCCWGTSDVPRVLTIATASDGPPEFYHPGSLPSAPIILPAPSALSVEGPRPSGTDPPSLNGRYRYLMLERLLVYG